MPDPKEEVRRSTQFDPERLEDHNKNVNEALSSKRQKDPDEDKASKTMPSSRPSRSKRSGSDSNASNKTRGH